MILGAFIAIVIVGLTTHLALCLVWGFWNPDVPGWTIAAAIVYGLAGGIAGCELGRRYLP